MPKKNEYLASLEAAKDIDISLVEHMNGMAEVVDSAYDNLCSNELESLSILLHRMDSVLQATDDEEEHAYWLKHFIIEYVDARQTVIRRAMLARKTDTGLLESAQIPDKEKH